MNLSKIKSVIKGEELLKEQATQNKLLKKSEDHKQKNLEKNKKIKSTQSKPKLSIYPIV